MAGFLDSLMSGVLGQTNIPAFQRVDLGQLQSLAKDTSISNYMDSLKTQAQGRPDLAASRVTSDKNLASTATANNGVAADVTNRLKNDFALGGNLPIEVQNQITQAAGQKAAGTGGNLGAITARDIGQSALGLRNQRTQALQQQNQLNNSGQLAYTSNPDNMLPQVGLNGGQLAAAATADTNALNSYNQMAAQLQAQNAKNATQGIMSGISGLNTLFTPNTPGARSPLQSIGSSVMGLFA